MSSPLIGVGEEEEEGRSNVTLLASSSSMDSIHQNVSELKERNYMGLSDCSSVDSSTISTSSADNSCSFNLKATELRLGLPGSQSPERDPELCLLSSSKPDEKPLFPLHPSKDNTCSLSQKTLISGNKRGFSDAMDGFSERKIAGNSEVNAMLSPRTTPNLAVKSGTAKDNPVTQPAKMKEAVPQHLSQERPRVANESGSNCTNALNNSSNAQGV